MQSHVYLCYFPTFLLKSGLKNSSFVCSRMLCISPREYSCFFSICTQFSILKDTGFHLELRSTKQLLMYKLALNISCFMAHLWKILKSVQKLKLFKAFEVLKTDCFTITTDIHSGRTCNNFRMFSISKIAFCAYHKQIFLLTAHLSSGLTTETTIERFLSMETFVFKNKTALPLCIHH